MQKVGQDYNRDAKRQSHTLRFVFLAEETVKGRPTVLQFTVISEQEERGLFIFINSLINQ